MAIHQLIPCFTHGDATGQAAIHLRLLLRRLGHPGEIFAREVDPSLHTLVRPLGALRVRADDLVLYHHGFSCPLAFTAATLPCRRGLVFHNISPERFYRGTHLEEGLRAGRAELAVLARRMDLSIGVSDFNAAELRAAGHANVHTVPLFVEPERFAARMADPGQLRLVPGSAPTVLSVSRVVAHKRVEDLLSLHEELRRIRYTARLQIVGGYEPGGAYFRALARRAKEIGNVELLGRIDHAGLVAAYRSASVYVSMSEHEGFGVPLVEAMAAELPVLAFAAAAVPETLGGAGIAFTEKRFAFLAELVTELCDNPALRTRILAGQQRRLEQLSADKAQARLADALATVSGSESVPPSVHPERRRNAPESKGQNAPDVLVDPRESASRSGHLVNSDPSTPDLRSYAQGERRSGASSSKRGRLAVIVQRYGDVTGGAEKHAEQIAERLASSWDVTVLTTCAKDHLTWANELPPGEERRGPVRVLRFPTERARRMAEFNGLSGQLFGKRLERGREEHWVAEQGPLSPGLFAHLAEQRGDYDAFLFFTYLYATTAWGLPLVADRALLVPTAHDEPALAFHVYDEVFSGPRALLCNTEEELALIDRRFPGHARAKVVGIGVDVPEGRPERFRKAREIDGPYLFYVGRLEKGKGLLELLAYHRARVEADPDAPWLVLGGTGEIAPRGKKVLALGRISEEEKHDAIAGAQAVVVPSKWESLSLLALEAFAHGVPVLGNGDSEVLAGHVRRSGAGATYRDAREFERGLEAIASARAELAERARRYAALHRWSRVMETYDEELSAILETHGARSRAGAGR